MAAERGRGIDLINQAVSNSDTDLPPELEEIRANTIISVGESLYYGARPRPLLRDGSPVGYARGLRQAEKYWLNNMFPSPVDRTVEMVLLATTLTREQVYAMSAIELKRVLQLIHHETRSDSRLLGWVYPYSTTIASEKLWCCKMAPPAHVELPHGTMPTKGVSDLYLHWAFMANLREETKVSLRETMNAAMIVRSHIGKAAQQLSNELNSMQAKLKSNIAQPWLESGSKLLQNVDFDDGWGHSHQDQSLDGLMREYWGMVNEDKHEQFMNLLLEKQQKDLVAERERIRSLKNRVEGITYKEKFLTPKEMFKRDAERRKAAEDRQKATLENQQQMYEDAEVQSAQRAAQSQSGDGNRSARF